MTAVDEVDDF